MKAQRATSLAGQTILVTGCGTKPKTSEFYDVVTGQPTHDPILIDGVEHKMNIGTAIAYACARDGACVRMVARSGDALRRIKTALDDRLSDDTLLSCHATDLLDAQSVANLVATLPTHQPLHWVQSVGLGAGNYAIKNDNPYLPVTGIETSLIRAELGIVEATHHLMRELLELFRQQRVNGTAQENRIVGVSSMTAVRGYIGGSAHGAAKGALDRYLNAVMLESYLDNIFVTTVRPGGIDTGMYDHPDVQSAVKRAASGYGCPWSETGIRLAPPSSVADAVIDVLRSGAHITSFNLVAKGQFPHEGS